MDAVCAQQQIGKGAALSSVVTSLMVAGNANAASEVAQLAAGDNRLGIIAFLFLPVVRLTRHPPPYHPSYLSVLQPPMPLCTDAGRLGALQHWRARCGSIVWMVELKLLVCPRLLAFRGSSCSVLLCFAMG